MSTNTDTNKYTILFAIGMVVVVGSLLALQPLLLNQILKRMSVWKNNKTSCMQWASMKTEQQTSNLLEPIKLQVSFQNTSQNN